MFFGFAISLVLKKQLDGFLEIGDGRVDRLAEAGNIDIQALGYEKAIFLVHNVLELPHGSPHSRLMVLARRQQFPVGAP
jgi:hypothetical protein